MTKEQIITAIRAFVAQRSGIDFRNYGSMESLMGDYRPMLRAGRDARALLAYVSARDSISADDIVKATRAYSGRLQLAEREGKVEVDYCTGQYFPTEYRKAACAVLAEAIWCYWRESCPIDEIKPDKATPSLGNVGEYVQKKARQEFGRGIASRWFN